MHSQICLLPLEEPGAQPPTAKLKRRTKASKALIQQPSPKVFAQWGSHETKVIVLATTPDLYEVGIIDLYRTTDNKDIAARFLRLSRHTNRGAAQYAYDRFVRRAFQADCLGAKLPRFATAAAAPAWCDLTPEQYAQLN